MEIYNLMTENLDNFYFINITYSFSKQCVPKLRCVDFKDFLISCLKIPQKTIERAQFFSS